MPREFNGFDDRLRHQPIGKIGQFGRQRFAGLLHQPARGARRRVPLNDRQRCLSHDELAGFQEFASSRCISGCGKCIPQDDHGRIRLICLFRRDEVQVILAE